MEQLKPNTGRPRGQPPAPPPPLEVSKKIYNWDTDTFEVVREDEVPSRSGGPVASNSMMNSKTRSILDKLRESTAALEGEMGEPQEATVAPRQPPQVPREPDPFFDRPQIHSLQQQQGQQQPRKKSRFLNRDFGSTSPEPPRGQQPPQYQASLPCKSSKLTMF